MVWSSIIKMIRKVEITIKNDAELEALEEYLDKNNKFSWRWI